MTEYSIAKLERFAKLFIIDQETGCWVWQRRLSRGYGQFGEMGAYRWLYQAIWGELTPGLHCDHLCRNKACVNPRHIEPVTPRINYLRGESPVAINYRRTHCAQGHEFTPENTRMRSNGRYTWRTCRVCFLASLRANRLRIKALKHPNWQNDVRVCLLEECNNTFLYERCRRFCSERHRNLRNSRLARRRAANPLPS